MAVSTSMTKLITAEASFQAEARSSFSKKPVKTGMNEEANAPPAIRLKIKSG